MILKSNAIAVLGGFFNPIHCGHLLIARSVKSQLGYDLILFVPSAIPPHKDADLQATSGDRISMIELAVADIDYIRVETCEIERGGVSYTIDTIDYLKKHYTMSGKPGLIIGDDLIEGFHKWKSVDTLVKQVDLIVARRDRSERKEFEFEHTYLSNPLIDVASSDIRVKVRSGETVEKYLPHRVIRYIQTNGLYK